MILIIPAIFVFLGLIYFLGGSESIGHGGYVFMGAYVLAHLAMAVIWYLWPFKRNNWILILLIALIARALMFPLALSDDVNRYLWEGKIQEAGFSPFMLSPDAEALAPLRDDNWEGINHKQFTTIYPPAAQLTFRLGFLIWPDGRCLRLIFTLFDLGTLLVLFGLAREYKVHFRHLLLYAINPLVLLYVAGEGHLDPTAIFFVMAALLTWKRQKIGFAFLLLGMGVMFKLLPLIFFPLLIERANWKKAFLFFVPFLLYLPYLECGWGLLDTPATFVGAFFYNAFLFSILQTLVSASTAIVICWILFLLTAAAIFFLAPDPFRACFLMAGAFLLLTPVLHQWYFLLILPFLPFFRSAPWLVLMASVGATFVTRMHQVEVGEWWDSPLAKCIEYGSFLLLWIWVLVKGKVTGLHEFSPPKGVTVVIPVLNEQGRVLECIDSVKDQVQEIIVVDGGSEDNTKEEAGGVDGVNLLESSAGRGNQIAKGVDQATEDVILVVHGDSKLCLDAVERMLKGLIQNPAAPGGAFGHSYGKGSLRFSLIALLDNLRARFLGLSFGNQAQFFRRDALPEGFPCLRLMEDMELSFLLKTKGSPLYLPKGVMNRARRWEKKAYLGNVGLVLSILARFIFSRRMGRLSKDGDEFYKRYYGS